MIAVDDAVKETGVSRNTIYRWIRLGLVKTQWMPGLDKRTFVDVDAITEIRKRKGYLLAQSEPKEDKDG